MKKNDIAKSLFGEVEVGDRGYHNVDPESILKPFKYENSAARMFCENCEGVYEIPQEVADEFKNKIEGAVELERGSYFSVDGCAVCLKERTSVEVKKIEIH